jgi:hypothetical protein
MLFNIKMDIENPQELEQYIKQLIRYEFSLEEPDMNQDALENEVNDTFNRDYQFAKDLEFLMRSEGFTFFSEEEVVNEDDNEEYNEEDNEDLLNVYIEIESLNALGELQRIFSQENNYTAYYQLEPIYFSDQNGNVIAKNNLFIIKSINNLSHTYSALKNSHTTRLYELYIKLVRLKVAFDFDNFLGKISRRKTSRRSKKGKTRTSKKGKSRHYKKR